MITFKNSLITYMTLTSLMIITPAFAQPAISEKQAAKATELRQSVFKLLGSNMGALGAMAKGRIPMDSAVVEKNAERINQLSLMIADYSRSDTSNFDIRTEALPKIWKAPKEYSEAINNLTVASSALITASKSNDESAIKKAIGGVGKTCGGCHDNFKKD